MGGYPALTDIKWDDLRLGARTPRDDPHGICGNAEKALVGVPDRQPWDLWLLKVRIGKYGNDRTRLGRDENLDWGWLGGQWSGMSPSDQGSDPAAGLMQACMHVKFPLCMRQAQCGTSYSHISCLPAFGIPGPFAWVSFGTSHGHVGRKSHPWYQVLLAWLSYQILLPGLGC